MDNVNHPPHYNKGKVETIDAIESALGHQGFVDYCVGNVIKYASRWRDKGGVEDLRKAQWYLNKVVTAIDDSSKPVYTLGDFLRRKVDNESVVDFWPEK